MLIVCFVQPYGSARYNFIIQYALSIVSSLETLISMCSIYPHGNLILIINVIVLSFLANNNIHLGGSWKCEALCINNWWCSHFGWQGLCCFLRYFKWTLIFLSRINSDLCSRQFFEMQRRDAVRALDIYKKSAAQVWQDLPIYVRVFLMKHYGGCSGLICIWMQAEKLSEFFEICRSLEFGRRQKYVKIEQVPNNWLLL